MASVLSWSPGRKELTQGRLSTGNQECSSEQARLGLTQVSQEESWRICRDTGCPHSEVGPSYEYLAEMVSSKAVNSGQMHLNGCIESIEISTDAHISELWQLDTEMLSVVLGCMIAVSIEGSLQKKCWMLFSIVTYFFYRRNFLWILFDLWNQVLV